MFSRLADRWQAFWFARRKYEWIFSGVIQGQNNALADAGYFRSPRRMSKSQAIRYVRDIVPRATVTHVDDVNKIVTYKLL